MSYDLYFRGNLPDSPYKYELLGLNLLFLLSQRRLADFHVVRSILIAYLDVGIRTAYD